MMNGSETKDDTVRYDVAVLGNHVATALLAAILARNGVRTVLVQTEADRGMPAGETTVPYTAELFFLLGRKFGIPAISRLGMFSDLPDALRTTSGIKRSLGFLYHRPGLPQRPAEVLQFNVPGEHVEWHMYRPAADDYAARVAAENGATVLGGCARPGGVRTSADGIAIELTDGGVVEASYLVNGSADPAMLPEGADGPATGRTRHRSRLLFAHVPGVRPFESVVPLHRYGKASPWSEGTLLHVFDGGWIQITPFGNHALSHNQLSSVAVSLDPAAAPRKAHPSAEFQQVAGRFPELAKQFADVPEVQWRVYEAWPAVAAQCAGPRWFLFDRAAGRHDLLLSRDLTMSLELVHATATGLLAMARSGDWAGDGMKGIEAFQLAQFEFHDRFVAAGRVAAADFRLWNAYLRTWLLWSILSALSLKRARLDGEAAAGPVQWSATERFGEAPYWYPVPGGLRELILETLRDIESVPLGTPAQHSANRIFARLRRERFVPPLYRFGDPNARYYHFTRARRLRMLLWAKTTAPADFRRLLTADNVTAVPQTRNT